MGAEQSKAEERNRQRQEQEMKRMMDKIRRLEMQVQTSPQTNTRAPVETAKEASEREAIRRRQQPKSILTTVDDLVQQQLDKLVDNVIMPPIKQQIDKLFEPTSSRAAQQPGTSRNLATQTLRAQENLSPSTSMYSKRTEQQNTTRESFTTPSYNNLYPNLGNAVPTVRPQFYTHSPQTTCQPSTSRATNEDFVFVDKNKRLQPTAPPEPLVSQANQYNSKRDRSVSRTRCNAKNSQDDGLNCRSCQNKYGLNIFQCLEGHSSCRDCKMRGAKCGVCGHPITDMRNITLEAFIAEKMVPCPNKNDGCCLSFKMADIDSHLKECPFSDLACPLTTALLQHCNWRGKISQMGTHFEDNHPQYRSSVDTENFITEFRGNSYSLQFIELGNFKFLVHLKVSQTDGMVFMAVQLLGTGISASKWRYELHVYNKGEPRRKYQHTDICYSHGTPANEIFDESKCASIPLSYARSFGNHRNSLTYKIFIRKQDFMENTNARGRGRGRGGGRGRGRGRGRAESASRAGSEGSASPNMFDDY